MPNEHVLLGVRRFFPPVDTLILALYNKEDEILS